jgi:hypothetical protein
VFEGSRALPPDVWKVYDLPISLSLFGAAPHGSDLRGVAQTLGALHGGAEPPPHIRGRAQKQSHATSANK